MRIFRINFLNQGKIYEIHADSVGQSEVYGFIEVKGLIFGESSTLVIDPVEDKLKNEFGGVSRTLIPIHSVIRIDEVEQKGPEQNSRTRRKNQYHAFSQPLPRPRKRSGNLKLRNITMSKHDAIREKLLQRRHELNERIHEITRDVRHTDGPLPSDFSEQATERENEEVMDALGAAGREELSRINRILARIDSDEYGICAECGEPIPEARLEILPTSEFCVSCAEKQGK